MRRGSTGARTAGSGEVRGRTSRARLNRVRDSVRSSPVEELECVEGSEPESPAGVGESFGAPSVAGQRPAQDVVSVDAWARALRLPREGKRAPKMYAVVDVEERSLEIGANAVCDQQPFDDADERVLLRRGALAPGAGIEVAECRDGLGERQRLGGTAWRSRARVRGGPSPLRRAPTAPAHRRSPGTRPGRPGSAVRPRPAARATTQACRVACGPRPSARAGCRPRRGRAPWLGPRLRCGRAARARTRSASTRKDRGADWPSGRRPGKPRRSVRARRASRRGRRSCERCRAPCSRPAARGGAPPRSGGGPAPASPGRSRLSDRPERARSRGRARLRTSCSRWDCRSHVRAAGRRGRGGCRCVLHRDAPARWRRAS